MKQYTKAELETMTKEERGKIWIAGVLAKEPDYDVAELESIWDDARNTHETYEEEADKMKWLEDAIAEADASGYVEMTVEEMRAKINRCVYGDAHNVA